MHITHSALYLSWCPYTLLNLLGYCKMKLINNQQIKMAWFMHFLQEKLNVTKECFTAHKNWGEMCWQAFCCKGLAPSVEICQKDWQQLKMIYTGWRTGLVFQQSQFLQCELFLTDLCISPGLSTERTQETKEWHFIVCLYRNEISDSGCWLFQTHDNEMALFFYSPVTVNSL